MKQVPNLDDILTAAKRISPYAHKTPVLTCSTIDEMAHTNIYFKCENFQKVGAFKFRGACNTVFSLSDEKAERGVGTHSSGNHAAAVALAAKLRGTKAHVVMPKNAPEIKKKAVMGYYGDELVSRLRISSGISDDPLFTFKLKATKEADIKVVFIDNFGKKWEASKKIGRAHV